VERDIVLMSQNGDLRNWWPLLDLAYGSPGLDPINVCKAD